MSVNLLSNNIFNSSFVTSLQDKVNNSFLKNLNPFEKAALASSIISAGILIPDGLNNAYNYHAFTKFNDLSFVFNNILHTTRYTLHFTIDGFHDAAGGQAWRLFGCASIALGIAGLAFRYYGQSYGKMDQLSSIEKKQVSCFKM